MEKFNHENTAHMGSDARRRQDFSTAPLLKEESAIAYLGPAGTFTHEAALSVFGHKASYRACRTIEDVFRWVERGLSSRGVVPRDNAYAGSVHITMDLLYTKAVKIQGEILSQIHLHLLSQAPFVEQVKRVYSHPMAIAQCSNWLKNHLPHVAVSEVASTALAVKTATREPNAAAIGSRFAGIINGLASLKAMIEDNPDNVTRFLVLGKEQPKPTGKDKTSILFVLNQKPGALYNVLKVLSERGIHVSRVETRPEKRKKWECLYYLEMEGHETDRPIGEALTDIDKHCTSLKRLGSYAAGKDPGRAPGLQERPALERV
jgi:chorismate mutase/prephenate dehydratase